MWARHIEAMLACWLGLSPFIFAESTTTGASLIAWISSGAVVVFSLISYWPRARRAYLFTAAMGLFIAGWAYLADSAPTSGAHQNLIVVGVILMMTGILPCYNNEPPEAWRNYRADQTGGRRGKPQA